MLLVFVLSLLGLCAVVGILFWVTSAFYLSSQTYHEEYLDFDMED